MRVPMEMRVGLAPTLLLLALMLTAVVSAADIFSDALLGLKSELIDGSNSLHDWSIPTGGSTPGKILACSWSGITCTKNSSMIVGLDLSRKSLSGSISGKHIKLLYNLEDLNLSHNSFSGQLPPEIFNLTNLRSLDISRNNFSGQFPAGISAVQHLVLLDAFSNSFSGPLPPEVAQLGLLKVLNLAGSYFDGPIPSDYGSFKSLEFLHLAGNLLNGEIPPELGKLKTITHMEIGYNSYHGSIPWQLGNMSELQYLDMADANLSGPIPNHLCNLTNLRSLFLFMNWLTGSIPQGFGNITSLVSLDLSDNRISGSIPDSFAGLKNLRLLSLMYNDMSGSVPESIAELPLLDTLLIWNNLFSGPLPQSLGRNSKLKWVDVSTNSLTGSIPPDICAGGTLLKLMLFSNYFTGGLSPLANCSSLVRLRVEDNSFSGEIPLKFSLLPDITYVDLAGNKFTGGIPRDIWQASKLQYFNISENPGLQGELPAKTWSLPLLQNFSAFSCNISGNLPPFGSCNSVSVLELNRNSLSGSISDSIANCQALERMELAYNNLTGYLPVVLASLPTLRIVDLSHNEFKGSIPVKFGNSSSLALLNVSFNDISGYIPPEQIFRSMGATAFIGNPQLCGEPLSPCPDSEEIPHVAGFRLGSKGTEKLIWVLLPCAGVVLLIVMAALAIFYLQKGSNGQWKMVPFIGLPRFTANDVLRSFSYTESIEPVPPLSAPVSKVVLPTGITVSVKKIEWGASMRGTMTEFITRMGNARHKNLTRLLGFCSNKHVAYLLYDYLPNGNLAEKMNMKRESPISTWSAKYKLVIGIARGLCYLHHECYPAIPHGDLKASNIVFDENLEPHLAEFGLRTLLQMSEGSLRRSTSSTGTLSNSGDFNSTTKDELCRDIYSFGEVLLEIITNGRLTNGGASIHSTPKDRILKEIYDENEVGAIGELKEETELVLEVALLCTRSRPSDRPSMEDALKLLSGLRPHSKHC
ncbi:leucine-rich repeat receptor-like protein kinase TDR [Telopea speciosissima]|uniref:leucine-rich repeat receptor-like protein kinase TDR n=1 Tax=Telopea speciosissima TaxID=54955 RepID=UPI001CC453B3|nr:leucine-rich repeat receptor-like protein kinase TDR [Telopea speciosissima]